MKISIHSLIVKFGGYVREFLMIFMPLIYTHPPQQNRFVLYGRGRTGSTLLTELLNQSGELFCDKEIFNRKVWKPFTFLKNRQQMFKAPIYGFKLLSYQLKERIKPSSPQEFMRHLVEDEGYKLIYMTRENLLRQTLSKHYATFRDSWHEKNSVGEKPMMTVDIPTLLNDLAEGELLASYERNAIAGLNYLTVSYEQDLGTPQKQEALTKRLSHFFDIKPFKTKSTLQKITGNKLKDFILNHQELEKSLINTRFASMLD
jgi:LPS sulfotransferase NodH